MPVEDLEQDEVGLAVLSCAVELAAVEHVYRHFPITPEVVARLNPGVSLSDLAADISDICYPG